MENHLRKDSVFRSHVVGAGPDLHLPDASPDPARGPGYCPICGMALEPVMRPRSLCHNAELARYDAAFLDRLAVRLASRGPGDGRPSHASAGRQIIFNWIQFALATPVVLWAGWPFFVRAWHRYCIRSLNMFTLDRDGYWRRLALQRRRDCWCRQFFPRLSGMGGASRSISRRRPSSPSSSFLAKSSNCARASRRRARSAPCSISHPRRRAGSTLMAAKRKFRSTVQRRRQAARAARAKKCRSMARCVEGRTARRRIDGHRRIDAGHERRRATN